MAKIGASQPYLDVRVMTLFSDEAERWINSLKESDFVVKCENDAPGQQVYRSKPELINNKSEEAVRTRGGYHCPHRSSIRLSGEDKISR